MKKEVLVETSARHVHVSQADLETLFGAGYELTKKKDLSQPGQFACEERVAVVGPKSSFPAVSILGPERPETQVELSAGDARSIGVKAPIRESGDLEGSAPCKLVGPKGSFPTVSILGPTRPDTQLELSASDARSIGVVAPCRESGDVAGSGACKLVGPKGEVELGEGAIVAKRHIHMTPADAEKYDLQDKQIVSVKVKTDERSLIFGDVIVRVSPSYALAMHIDTDESNAACCTPGLMGEIIA